MRQARDRSLLAGENTEDVPSGHTNLRPSAPTPVLESFNETTDGPDRKLDASASRHLPARPSCESDCRALEAAEGAMDDVTLALEGADTLGSKIVEAVDIGLRLLGPFQASESSSRRKAVSRERNGTRDEASSWDDDG